MVKHYKSLNTLNAQIRLKEQMFPNLKMRYKPTSKTEGYLYETITEKDGSKKRKKEKYYIVGDNVGNVIDKPYKAKRKVSKEEYKKASEKFGMGNLPQLQNQSSYTLTSHFKTLPEAKKWVEKSEYGEVLNTKTGVSRGYNKKEGWFLDK